MASTRREVNFLRSFQKIGLLNDWKPRLDSPYLCSRSGSIGLQFRMVALNGTKKGRADKFPLWEAGLKIIQHDFSFGSVGSPKGPQGVRCHPGVRHQKSSSWTFWALLPPLKVPNRAPLFLRYPTLEDIHQTHSPRNTQWWRPLLPCIP